MPGQTCSARQARLTCLRNREKVISDVGGKLVMDDDRVFSREAHLRAILETTPNAMNVIDERRSISH